MKLATARIIRQARMNRANQTRHSGERKDQAKTLLRWRQQRGRKYARTIWCA